MSRDSTEDAAQLPGTIAEAKQLQQRLADEVQTEGKLPETRVRHIAGVDASISRDGKQMIGVICVLSWPELEVVELVSAVALATFPYVPGYLSFRELPVLLQACEKLRTEVDLALVDGQGIAHPRRLGLASHFGLTAGLVSIGCAKSRLVGEAEDPGIERGQRSALMDRGERVGTLLRTRRGVKPVWVSVGHGLSLSEAERWIMNCSPRFRLPEPIRCAHKGASEIRQTYRAGS